MSIIKKVQWPSPLRRPIRRLEKILLSYSHPLVAYSGGVDSSFLMTMAQRVLGNERVLGVTVAAPMMAQEELKQARALARRYGFAYHVVRMDPLSTAKFRSNPPDRCYHCKRMILKKLTALAKIKGCDVIIEGSHQGDAGDYRPGRKALREAGARSPLREAGFNKAAIREASRCLGLPTAGKPSMACLASRIPYGTPIMKKQLQAIDRAETALRKLGFVHVRVRAHDNVARVEVAPEAIKRLLSHPIRLRVVSILKHSGFLYAALDLEGYRTGSLNEVLLMTNRRRLKHGRKSSFGLQCRE